jgi:hypothetical protein
VIPIAALLLASLLTAIDSLRAAFLTNLDTGIPPLEKLALILSSLTLMLAIASAIPARRTRPRLTLSARCQWCMIGLGLFTLPALLASLAHNALPEATQAALWTLIPLLTLALEPHIVDTHPTRPSAPVPAALLPVFGALLVFPISLPSSLQTSLAWLAFFTAVAVLAAATCFAVRAMQTGQPDSAIKPRYLLSGPAIASGTAGFSLLLCSLLFEHPILQPLRLAQEALLSAVTDAPALALVFWLFPRLTATQINTRFVLVPLFAILPGALQFGAAGQLQPRTWLGLACMAAGAMYLLRPARSGPESTPLFPPPE